MLLRDDIRAPCLSLFSCRSLSSRTSQSSGGLDGAPQPTAFSADILSSDASGNVQSYNASTSGHRSKPKEENAISHCVSSLFYS